MISATELRPIIEASYGDAVAKNGFISFITTVRSKGGKYNIKRVDVDRMFASKAWRQIPDGGHNKFQHRLLGIVVEYQAHEKDLDPGAATTVMETLQKVVNILGNDVFCYETSNWKSMPDFTKSVTRAQGLFSKLY